MLQSDCAKPWYKIWIQSSVLLLTLKTPKQLIKDYSRVLVLAAVDLQVGTGNKDHFLPQSFN
ncbi:hypothetical protein E2542_SST14308 [Spatholobus suberectus]|nr:hypothetical protein E2542_SST14308 [Spatholobus suberectus]